MHLCKRRKRNILHNLQRLRSDEIPIFPIRIVSYKVFVCFFKIKKTNKQKRQKTKPKQKNTTKTKTQPKKKENI